MLWTVFSNLVSPLASGFRLPHSTQSHSPIVGRRRIDFDL
jgi:hypothetical protein